MADPDCDFCGDLGCVYCDSDDDGNDYDLTQYNDDDCGACDSGGCRIDNNCDNLNKKIPKGVKTILFSGCGQFLYKSLVIKRYDEN